MHRRRLGHRKKKRTGEKVFDAKYHHSSPEYIEKVLLLINLEIPVLVRSLKSSNVELG